MVKHMHWECEECKRQVEVSLNETTGENACDDCGTVLGRDSFEKKSVLEEGTPTKNAFSPHIRADKEIRPGDIRASLPHRGKRKFSSKKKEKAFNEKKHKKVRRKLATLEKDYNSASVSKKNLMEKAMIEDGWEGGEIPSWKHEADSSMVLRNTKLDRLGLTLPVLESIMKQTIHGADVPERGLYLDSGGAGSNQKIVTPKKEGSALHMYIKMTHDNGAFWFFEDFCGLFPVNREDISSLLSSAHPLSTQAVIQCDNIFERGITSDMIANFTKRAGNAMGFDTNGLEDDRRPPLPFDDGILPEDFKQKISLCPMGDDKPSPIFRWIGMEEIAHERITKGVLRPSRHPLLLMHIPLAYSLAQRVYENLRQNDQWRNIAMRILNMIEADVSRWCPSTVEEMDRWWSDEVKKSSSMGDTPVTTLRASHP